MRKKLNYSKIENFIKLKNQQKIGSNPKLQKYNLMENPMKINFF